MFYSRYISGENTLKFFLSFTQEKESGAGADLEFVGVALSLDVEPGIHPTILGERFLSGNLMRTNLF